MTKVLWVLIINVCLFQSSLNAQQKNDRKTQQEESKELKAKIAALEYEKQLLEEQIQEFEKNAVEDEKRRALDKQNSDDDQIIIISLVAALLAFPGGVTLLHLFAGGKRTKK